MGDLRMNLSQPSQADTHLRSEAIKEPSRGLHLYAIGHTIIDRLINVWGHLAHLAIVGNGFHGYFDTTDKMRQYVDGGLSIIQCKHACIYLPIIQSLHNIGALINRIAPLIYVAFFDPFPYACALDQVKVCILLIGGRVRVHCKCVADTQSST